MANQVHVVRAIRVSPCLFGRKSDQCGFTDHVSQDHDQAMEKRKLERQGRNSGILPFDPLWLTCDSCGKTGHSFKVCDEFDAQRVARSTEVREKPRASRDGGVYEGNPIVRA